MPIVVGSSTTTPAATATLGELVNRVLRLLIGSRRPTINRLDGAVTSGATTVLMEFDADNISQGTILGIDDEALHVWSLATKTATVERGMLGTAAAAHADNALVEVNPEYPRGVVLQVLREEVESWPRDLYKATTVEVSVGGSEDAVDLGVASTVDVIRLVSAWVDPISVVEEWAPINVTLERDQNTTDFPSTYALRLGGTLGRSRTLRVTYATPLDTSTWTSGTTLTDVGMSGPMADGAIYGTAARLFTEGPRGSSFAQGQSRSAEEVPALARLRTAGTWFGLRDRFLSDARRDLLADYPYMMP